ncbi:uncharacterized protein BXZ73DRAFT_81431 [Epithele typhae]|uniref:uncharacterized protein n=1 Tax=Epithele typhae TaxID=378194 RepID=UPI0020085B41|nr:uncharacterized protein BXZ73DRAFT_81431 [Epithele typhae]KAH9915171.1 hypothetical protein BXZ73DRAFT_81431 [Epithele typhae]
MHSSRPIRSSPLAGPSIAPSSNNPSLLGVRSAPPTPGCGPRHLSPLAEFSIVPLPTDDDEEEGSGAKKQKRRRSLGVVLTKLSFPSSSTSHAPAAQEPAAAASPRRRTKSASARTADVPSVPPVPAWAQQPGRSGSPSPSARASSPLPSPPRIPSARGSPASSRASSPTPSTASASRRSVHSTRSVRSVHDPSLLVAHKGGGAEDNWMTQVAAPRFSRLGLKAEGVVMPVRAADHKRRSAVPPQAGASKSMDGVRALPPSLPPSVLPSRSPSRTTAPSPHARVPSAPASMPSPAPARCQSSSSSSSSSYGQPPRPPARRRSPSSTSAASLDLDTPELSMSPGASASDVSLPDSALTEVGVLAHPPPVPPLPPLHVLARARTASQGSVAFPDDYDLGPAHGHAQKPATKARGVAVDVRSVASMGSIGSLGSVGSSVGTTGSLGTVGSWGTTGSVGSAPSPVLRRAARSSSALNPAHGRPSAHAGAAEDWHVYGDKGEGDAEVGGSGQKRSRSIGRVWKSVVRRVSMVRRSKTARV